MSNDTEKRINTSPLLISEKNPSMDKINMGIMKEIVNDADVKSSLIASKYKIPLSTIQRRRARLEKTVLKKNFSIDMIKMGWRVADLFVSVSGGKSNQVAKKILQSNSNIVM